MLPKSGKAKYPTSQPITNNTTISQIKSLIIVGCFSVTLSYKLIAIDFEKKSKTFLTRYIILFFHSIINNLVSYYDTILCNREFTKNDFNECLT